MPTLMQLTLNPLILMKAISSERVLCDLKSFLRQMRRLFGLRSVGLGMPSTSGW